MSTSSNQTVGGDQRYRGGRECPICGGSENDDRGQGRRCYGFIATSGLYAHCSREEKAGNITQAPGSNTFAHKLKGECKCGVEHGPADPPKAPRKKASKGPIERTYDYVDEAGKLLFQVVRYKSKDFIQRRPNGTGGWVWSLGDTRRVLYRLPDLVVADPARPVYIVEGEKDVDNLRAAGLVATCNPMGQGKWKDDYNASLAGRIVHIIPDNDKVGVEHGNAVARSLSGVAKEVKLIDLAEACRKLELGELPEKGDASDFFEMGGTAESLRRAFEGVEPRSDRPEIEINTQWHLAVDQTVKALAVDPSLYWRSDMLVRVVQETQDEQKVSGKMKLKGLAGSPKIIHLSDSNVGCTLTAVAEFFKWKFPVKGEPHTVNIPPPDWLIKSVATLKHWPGLRELQGVAECPFPRPDGSIVDRPGYDRETATLYAPSIAFPPIPAAPTRADAVAAWQRIRRFVEDFPFATDDDEAVYLAGLLTIIARPSIEGPAPGIAVIGNKAGTGKGLLVDAMVMPGTGRPCPTSTYPESSEEAVKVKVAIAKAAKVAVHFDNLERGTFYGGGPFDSALTSTVVDDRQLGRNDAPPLPLRSAWFLSGNNIHPCHDAYRRWLVCRLETEHDHPERRTDIKIPDLRRTILEHRGEIVRDALTILKAHALADHPKPKWDGFGSFEDWANVIRGAVWFATGRDCLVSQRGTDEDSDERQGDIALLAGWAEVPGGKADAGGLTAAEAIGIVRDNPKLYPILREALLTRGERGQLPLSSALGKILRGIKNTPIGDYILKAVGKKDNVVKWGVVCKQPKNQTGDTGDTGDGSNPRTRDFDFDSDVTTSGDTSEMRPTGPRASPVSLVSPVRPFVVTATNGSLFAGVARDYDSDEWADGRE